MKREINILWIEDNLNASVKEFQDEVKDLILSSMYEVNIFNTDTVQCIDFKNGKCDACDDKSDCNKNLLRDNKIDIIFSDNHLSNGVEGVDFLTQYRLDGEFKYYVLYSNLDEIDIVEKISEKLKENRKVHLFSNFDFISMNNWLERVDDTVAAFLNNRSKMQELRNMYIVENSLIEDILKNKNFSGNYKEQINSYCSSENIDSSVQSIWHNVRMDRNVLAHGVISFEQGYNVATGSNGREVRENEYNSKMSDLKTLTDELKNHNPNFYD